MDNGQWTIKLMKSQKGQIVLTIILVMTVVLAIGLSVIQKSLFDVSTSSKVEQSSRAFSAAEAGIEKALKGDTSGVDFSDNSSKADVLDFGFRPIEGAINTRQEPLEVDELTIDDVRQIWLADYTSSNNPPPAQYTQSSLEVYWGNSITDKAALELTLIYYNGTSYAFRKWYLDPDNRSNGFCQVPQIASSNCGGNHTVGTTTYQCKYTLGDGSPCQNGVVQDNSALPSNMMAIRARLLYNEQGSQPLAFWVPENAKCGLPCSLPEQKRELYSIGSSGDTERKVRVSQWSNVVPFYFDYAIFSAGDIKK